MSAVILLLEPYRSAILAQGIIEGILRSPVEDMIASPTMRIGGDPVLRRKALRLTLLFDELQLVHHEERGATERLAARGYQALSVLPLRTIGLVEFAGSAPAKERLTAFHGIHSLEEWWTAERELIETWEPLILGELLLKGFIPDVSFYHYLKAVRLGQNREATMYTSSHSVRERAQLAMLINPAPGGLPLDFSVFTALNELLQADDLVKSSGVRVAHHNLHVSEPPVAVTEAAETVLRVVIEELLGFELELPTISSIRQVLALRGNPDVVSFRDQFQPWLDALSRGDDDAERRLRKEVQKAARAFRNASRLERLNDALAFLALPAGFIPGAWGIGLGTALGITGIGLGRLARRWANGSRWLGWCEDAIATGDRKVS
jgi:hypothetical protein